MSDLVGLHSTTFDPELRNKIYIDIFYRVSCNIKCNTAISNVHFQ